MKYLKKFNYYNDILKLNKLIILGKILCRVIQKSLENDFYNNRVFENLKLQFK